MFLHKDVTILSSGLLQLMASNVVVVKFVILVVIAFMAVLPGHLQIAVAIRPDPPSNADSQISGRLRPPVRSGAGFIIEVLDHQYYTEDDSSARDLAINADCKLNAQSLMNKYPLPAAPGAPQNPKFHGQHLIKAYPPPPASNPTGNP